MSDLAPSLASAKEKIILPLDVPDVAAAVALVRRVAGVVDFYKVGLELFTRSGPPVIEQIRAAAEAGGSPCRIFLDLKLHDIPNTVAGAVRSAGALDVDLLTVHLSGGGAMLRAAVAEAPPTLRLLGVSVLTSSDAETLRETGVNDGVTIQVLRLAELGVESGLRGVVASPLEIVALRERFGRDLQLVIPGVRPVDRAQKPDDQRRVMTPGNAIRAGANYLVIGRPISGDPDPHAAAQRIAEEIAANLPSPP